MRHPVGPGLTTCCLLRQMCAPRGGVSALGHRCQVSDPSPVEASWAVSGGPYPPHAPLPLEQSHNCVSMGPRQSKRPAHRLVFIAPEAFQMLGLLSYNLNTIMYSWMSFDKCTGS